MYKKKKLISNLFILKALKTWSIFSSHYLSHLGHWSCCCWVVFSSFILCMFCFDAPYKIVSSYTTFNFLPRYPFFIYFVWNRVKSLNFQTFFFSLRKGFSFKNCHWLLLYFQLFSSLSTSITALFFLTILIFLICSVGGLFLKIVLWVFCSIRSPFSASCLMFNSENMCFVHFNTTLSLFWSVCFSKWSALAKTIKHLVVTITMF